MTWDMSDDPAFIESKARHPSTPDPLALLEELKPMSMPVLSVEIDALALLDHFDGDKAKTFEFLTELKDLLNG
jgi:hypothetical protein